MKALKIIGIIVGSAIALFLLIALILPKEYTVERSIIINKPINDVYSFTSDFNNYNSWQPWIKYDKNAKYEVSGDGYSVGSKISWVGNDQVGQGEMITTKLVKNKSWSCNINFFAPWESSMKQVTEFQSVDGGTKVTWKTSGKLSYPMARWMGLGFESMMAPEFERGLMQLKKFLESGKGDKLGEFNIILTEIENQKLYVIADSLSDMTQVSAKLGKAYEELGEFFAKNKLEMYAPPLAITLKYDMEKSFYVFEAGFPVKDNKIKPTGRIKAKTLNGGTVVKAVSFGSYEYITATYNQIMKFIKYNKYEIIGNSWEVYVNDPTKVKPEEIETHIYFPIKTKI